MRLASSSPGRKPDGRVEILVPSLPTSSRPLAFPDPFARPVVRVPVRRLHHPPGFEHLLRVVEAIFNDLGQSV